MTRHWVGRSITLAFFLILLSADSLIAQTSVTIAGDLQMALGCANNWDPACSATFLTYDANDTVWQGVFNVPAGSWQYKAALDGSWNVNYGLHASPGGANIPLTLPAPSCSQLAERSALWALRRLRSTPSRS